MAAFGLFTQANAKGGGGKGGGGGSIDFAIINRAGYRSAARRAGADRSRRQNHRS
jgi:hypothetical protein